MKAWYFATEDRKLRHGDNRPIVIGDTHEVEGDIALCERGLHASVDILDALRYAPGPVIYRVELTGDILKGNDKCVAQRRTYLSGGIDISEVLRKFARMCALDVANLWDAPEIVVRWLKTGDESIRATARAAAWSAAEDAAWSAAEATARAAAWFAARATTEAAAEAAARSAARATAEDASRKKQYARLERMVRKAIRGATDD